jgi:hypothetical protein
MALLNATSPVLGISNPLTNPAPASQPAQVTTPTGYDAATGVPYAPAASPAATPASTPNTTNTNPNTTGDSSSLTGTSFNAPGYIQGIQQEYGAQINAGPTNEALLQSGENQGIQGVNTNTAAQGNTYQAQANGEDTVLQNDISSQQNQQQLSLSELADQIRGQNQGLQAQLGAVGAGSSSANLAGQQALAHEQNTQQANIDQQANTNISGAQTQQAVIGNVLQANLAQLNTYKQNQINAITTQYGQLQQQLATALQTAQGEEKARLAEFGQNLTGSAIQSLTDLNNQINTQVQNLQAQGAQGDTSSALQNIPAAQAVAPITTQPLSPFTNNTQPGNSSGNTTAVPGGMTLSELLQQQQQQNPS